MPVATALVAAFSILLLDAAATAPLTEAQVRAGMLFNFASFVEWPDDHVPTGGAFVVGILGGDAVGDALREIRGRPIKGRALDVRRLDRDADVRACHIVYIPPGAENWQGLVSDVKQAPVLTIGEHPQFTRLGGVIRLYSENSRLRFEINVTRSQEAKLQVSSKLLGLAKIVREH